MGGANYARFVNREMVEQVIYNGAAQLPVVSARYLSRDV